VSSSGDESVRKVRGSSSSSSPTKYGTWKELQKQSKASMKQKADVEDTLKEDVERVMAGECCLSPKALKGIFKIA
jgi:hypothetical protein